MTKFLTVILLFICLVGCFFPFAAYADEATSRYARITRDGVALYANEQCDKSVFTLEKSYYVEILETLDSVYAVSVTPSQSGFPSVMGYVRKSEVVLCEATPIAPLYPSEQIYVTADSAPMRLLPLPSSEIVIVPTTTQRLNYYGEMSYYGNEYYYVYCAGKFGYVDKNSVSKPNIELHITPLEPITPTVKPQAPSESIDNPPEENNNKTPTAEILLIVFVALLAIGLTLALFLPGNVKKTEVFEQDI